MGNWIKNPKNPRTHETIGGGYFVFRRGDSTNRIRPSQWPFEYDTFDEAIAEAQRLAGTQPGYRFDVVGVMFSTRMAPVAAGAPAATVEEAA